MWCDRVNSIRVRVVLKVFAFLFLSSFICNFIYARALSAEDASGGDFISRVAKKLNISDEVATRQVEIIFKELSKELEAGNDVYVKDFGKFYTKDRASYTRKNPSNGAAVTIPSKRYPRFSPSDELKELVNKGK